jgi:hypothetical protein
MKDRKSPFAVDSSSSTPSMANSFFVENGRYRYKIGYRRSMFALGENMQYYYFFFIFFLII